MQFNEFSFSEHTRHLQLVHYKSHLNQPCKKKSANESMFYEAQWNFLIYNKFLKMSKDQKMYAHFCPMKNKEYLKSTKWKSQRSGNSSQISFISNSVSNPLVNFDFATHTHAKSEGLKHPAPRSLGQFPTKGEISYEKWAIEHKTQSSKTSNHGRNWLWKHHPLNIQISCWINPTNEKIRYEKIGHWM